MSFTVKAPGILSLLLDAGRFGQHEIGLTNGGPLDPTAFKWANRICGNSYNATAIEVSVGGLTLESQQDTQVALCGAELPLTINGKAADRWQTHAIKTGDKIAVGFGQEGGNRAYLAVQGGFQIKPQFNSSATVVREGVGGLHGKALAKGDVLPLAEFQPQAILNLAAEHRPEYLTQVELRVVPGYQQPHFSQLKQRLFFSSEYTVGELCDRMGYRLEGVDVSADINGILSEGICTGAIQVPADGQPIVLMNDRQTIGGYPKIGSVLSLDLAKLAQLSPGDRVRFTAISIDDAHQALLLAQRRFDLTPLETLEA